MPARTITRVAGCSCNFLQILRLEAGGANNMHGPGLRSEGREFHAGRWRGEVDNGLGFGKGLNRIIRNDYAARSPTHHHAKILTNPVVTGPLQCTDQLRFVACSDGLHQHLPHPATDAGHDNPWNITHPAYLSSADLSPKRAANVWQRLR